MFSKNVIITALVAIGLVVVLFFWVNTVPPKPQGGNSAAMAAGPNHQMNKFDVDSFVIAVKKTLNQHALSELQKVENTFKSATDSIHLAPMFKEYAKVWQEHKQFPLTAYYYYLAAKLEKSDKDLTFAAQLFLDLARREHETALQMWETNNSIAAFNQVLEITPHNDTVKLSLAECYFGTGDAMKGVALVKEVIAKDPENVAANLLLGQQGLISQQYEKAKERFEIVIKKEPKNLEALLGLAESYRGIGDKVNAKALLEKCKTLIDNPEFKKDIDNFIKTL